MKYLEPLDSILVVKRAVIAKQLWGENLTKVDWTNVFFALNCIKWYGNAVFRESVLDRCCSFSFSIKKQNSQTRQAVPVSFAASAQVAVTNKNLQRSTSECQYRRTAIKSKHVPIQSRFRDVVYLEVLVHSIHNSLEEERWSTNHVKTAKEYIIKNPVVRRLDETLSFKAVAIQCFLVPQTNLNRHKSLLFQTVTSRNDTEKKTHKETPIQTNQYSLDCTLQKTVFKRPPTRKLASLQCRFPASAKPSFEAPSVGMLSEKESCLENVQPAHVANLTNVQGSFLGFMPFSETIWQIAIHCMKKRTHVSSLHEIENTKWLQRPKTARPNRFHYNRRGKKGFSSILENEIPVFQPQTINTLLSTQIFLPQLLHPWCRAVKLTLR